MKLSLAWRSAIAIGIAFSHAMAQNPSSAELIARLQEYQDDYRMLKADLVALTERQDAMDRRLGTELGRLRQEIAALKESVARANANVATRESLDRLTEQVREVDKRRQEDAKFVARQIEELAKIPTSGPATSAPKREERREEKRDDHSSPPPTTERKTVTSAEKTPAPEHTGDAASAGEWKGDFDTHTIEKGEYLSSIIAAYNKELGLKVKMSDVMKANPGLDAKKLFVGKKILIPAVK